MLDKISELVFESVAPSKKISSGEWRTFCEHGLVTEKFLSQDTFNSHYVAGLFEVKNLIVLFEKLLALEILLGEMAQALERGVLSKEDCITAAIEKLHFEEDAVDAALQYLDQVSAIYNVLSQNPPQCCIR